MKTKFDLYVCNKKKCKECMFPGCAYTSSKSFAFVDSPIREVPNNTIYDGSYILRKNSKNEYYRNRKKNRHYNERY